MHHLIRIVFSIVEHALLPHHKYVATAIERFFESVVWVELKRPFSIEINGIKEIRDGKGIEIVLVEYLLNHPFCMVARPLINHVHRLPVVEVACLGSGIIIVECLFHEGCLQLIILIYVDGVGNHHVRLLI